MRELTKPDKAKLSKVSNKNIDDLRTIQDYLQRSIDYIKEDKTKICRVTSGTTTLDYENDGHYIRPFKKFIGSDLNYLINAKRRLDKHINEVSR